MIFSTLAQKTHRYYPVWRHKRLTEDKSASSTPGMQPQPSLASNFNKITQNIPKCHQETTDKHVFSQCFNGIRRFQPKNPHFERKKLNLSIYPPLYAHQSSTFTLFYTKLKQNIAYSLHFQRKISSNVSIFRRMLIIIRLITRLLQLKPQIYC